MTNNFTTIKSNQASEKFYLIRIIPRRVINSDLVSIGSGKYQCTFPYYINSVKANDTALTLVTTVVNPGEYSFNETTKIFTCYATPSSSNIIVVYYYLFFTGGRHRVITEDPENAATALRDWEPLIQSNPQITSSIENVVQGVLSVSMSSMILINDNRSFNQYLTDSDSFYRVSTKIWLCLDDIDNIQKIYDGRISRISLDDSQVNLSFEDPFGELLSIAYMGDEPDECYFNFNTFANLNPNSDGIPIKYIIGKASRYKTISEQVTNLTTAEKLDQSSLYEAICTNYSTDITTSNNRTWGICRVDSNGFINLGCTPSSVDNTDPNFTLIYSTAGNIDKFRIGDTILATQSLTDYYLRVYYVDRVSNYIAVTKEGAISFPGLVINTNNCPSILITNESDETYYCLYGRDYLTFTNTTSGGNKYLSITFVNNFEANHPGMAILDPGKYKVKYRVRPDITSAKHGSVVKAMLEHAGLSVDAASINNANSVLTANCAFSIPQFDETDYRRYIDYLQLILSSALSYITFANDFEIEYKLITTPSSTNEITDIDILRDSPSIDIDYQDIAHQIIAYNPHWSNGEGVSDSSATEISLKAKYLHNINNADRFRHVLEKITNRLSSIAAVKSNRKVIYNFDTKAINLDNILGDDILLSRDGILGNLTSKQLKIVSITKSPAKTNILATDLLGV